jgi:hypothetical protein
LGKSGIQNLIESTTHSESFKRINLSHRINLHLRLALLVV